MSYNSGEGGFYSAAFAEIKRRRGELDNWETNFFFGENPKADGKGKWPALVNKKEDGKVSPKLEKCIRKLCSRLKIDLPESTPSEPEDIQYADGEINVHLENDNVTVSIKDGPAYTQIGLLVGAHEAKTIGSWLAVALPQLRSIISQPDQAELPPPF